MLTKQQSVSGSCFGPGKLALIGDGEPASESIAKLVGFGEDFCLTGDFGSGSSPSD
jgi:hypothetical protein